MRLGKAFVNFVNATLHISNLIFVRNQTNEVEPMAADETESDSRHQDFQGERKIKQFWLTFFQL